MKFRKFGQITAKLLLVALIVLSFPLGAFKAQAASLTSMRAIASRLAENTNSGYVIYFVSPTGIQAGTSDDIILTFSSDFVLAAEAAANFDFAVGDSGTCTSASYTEETVALTASATEWGVDVAGDVVTFEPETDDTHAGGLCYRIEMGPMATSGGTGAADTVQNGALDNDDSIVFSGGFGDTGTIALDIISNDQVTITATVDPTITFTIDDNAIGFGTLSNTVGRWATADATGGNASPALPTAANVLTIATNASSGYALTYNGATLTSGGNTIDVATITGDGDGTQDTEQFGLSISTAGDATIASGYQRDATPDFNFVASTTTTIASETGPTSTETFSVSYLANIRGNTEAGAYSTTLTYIATGTF